MMSRRMLAALVALAVVAATTPSHGQGVQPAFPAPAVKVDPANPFGDLKAVVGASERDIVAWAKTLTPPQWAELNERCNYIHARQGNFPPEAMTFCQEWWASLVPG